MRALLLLTLLAKLACAELDTAPLEAWLKRQSSLRSLSADFVQERKLPALTKPLRTPGTLFILRPDKLCWQLGKPPKTYAISDGTTMTLVDVGKKQARQIPADSPRARQFTLLSDPSLTDLASFRKSFELIESRTTKGIYQLTTRPTDRSMRKQISWLFLDIDPTTSELRAIDVQLGDKSRIRTVFTTTKVNGDIDPSRFTPDLEGYRVK